ncbi:MAG TPA: hypothetical protein PLS50_02190 [Candidatus Dojkabacteria bacterium]|nr:hypothetical protein [Candidatus Dojkabacteria bacterium]
MPSFVTAQVIIKEKVEINPLGNILPDYPQSNFDPCLNINRPPYYQSVYSCSGYPVEPYQQMFPWQSGSYLGQLDSATIYNVEIISGTEYAYFYKVGYWDTLSNVQVDPEYIGSSLTGLTGVELAGWGEYRVYQGIGVLEREHFALYNIRFDNFDLQTALVTVRITNTSTNIVTDWHTTIVNPQYTMQNLGIDGDTVLHNRSMIITPNISNSLALTCNQFGYGSCPPTNVTFNIEIIQGQEYGNIGKYNDFFGSFEYSPAYTGLSYDEFRYGFYVFEANGLQPDSTAVVRIRQSSSDTDIGSFEYTLNIKRNFLPPVSENGSIVIETNKNTAMPGDTLDILLKWEDGSNGIVDFSDWQEFGVWLADGFGYGTLLDPVTGDTSDAFEVTGKELKLIVHQDVTDANKKIVIAAETEVAVLGGNRMIQNNLQPKTETKSTDKKIISNYRTVEQGGFVKANNKMDKLDAVDKDDDDGEINIDIIIGSQYLSGVKEITVNPFIVEIDPPRVSAGDTARIIPKYMDENGDYVEFDSLQTFELGMLDGCILGKLSSAGIDTNYFYGVIQPFYFIADSSADSGSVNIRVGVIEMNPQNRSLTNNNNIIPESDNPVEFCFLNTYQSKLTLDVPLRIEQKYEILLGEAKYYAVKKKIENGTVKEIKIEEITITDPDSVKFPANAGTGWDWIKEKSIWSDRPINIETKGQSPIFYDKFYAKVYYTGTTKPVIHDLPDGMIRVIGRYLGKTIDNKVKLFTTKYQNSFTDTLEIQVIRPSKLGDDILSMIGPTKVDYVDSTYNNIDSLVVDMAGQLGIPPQFLIGIIEQESPNGLGYRYEPFSDMLGRKDFKSTHRYWIKSETDLGNPTIPHHNNINDARGPIDNYPGYTTVWEIYNDKNTGKNKMYTFGPYPHMKENYWLPYQKNHFISLRGAGLDSLVAIDSSKVLADTSYIKFLRDSIEGIGMKGTIAQTRIYASYGFMQLVYSSSIKTSYGYNYPDNDPDFLPEYIMIPTLNIQYASKHLLGKLRDNLGKIKYPEEDTWSEKYAFELSYWNAFRCYNGKYDYPNKVFTHIKDNLPKKN